MVTINVVTLYPNIAHSQTSTNTTTTAAPTQSWIDKLNNVKIQFTYLPQKPLVDAPTELRFNVQDLQTGSHLKNLAAKVVIVTNSSGQERSFKFNNITAPDGNFAIKYLFPDTGQYQVISRIYSKDTTSLASFNVLVPFQPLGTISVNFALPAVLAAIIGTIAIVSIEIIIKRKKRQRRYNL